MEKEYTIREIAKRLGVHPETVRRWLREKTLIGFRFGPRSGWRVREKDLQEFIEKHMNTAEKDH